MGGKFKEKTHRHAQTHRHTYTYTRRHTDTQTHRHTDTHADTHADTQTHTHTHTHKNGKCERKVAGKEARLIMPTLGSTVIWSLAWAQTLECRACVCLQ